MLKVAILFTSWLRSRPYTASKSDELSAERLNKEPEFLT